MEMNYILFVYHRCDEYFFYLTFSDQNFSNCFWTSSKVVLFVAVSKSPYQACAPLINQSIYRCCFLIEIDAFDQYNNSNIILVYFI